MWEVIDPDGVDEVEGRLLEREEADARAKATLRMAPSGDGSTRGRFVIPDAQADMLKVALESMTSPRRPAADRPDQPSGDPDQTLDAKRLPYSQRLGLALCELIEHLPVDALPQAGRSTPTVTVTMDLDALRSGIGAAALSTGTKLSASQAPNSLQRRSRPAGAGRGVGGAGCRARRPVP